MSPELKPIRENLYQLDTPFFGVPLTLYVITGGDRTVLIDSGINTTPDEFIIPALEKANIKPDLLVNTHGHVDHFGGNSRIREVYPDIKIAVHTVDADWVEDTARHYAEMYMIMSHDWQFDDGGKGLLELCGENTAVDIHLHDNQIFPMGAYHFKVLRSTGHSPGHITFYDADAKIAISGDAALGWGPPTAEGTEGAPTIYFDPDAYLAGADQALSLQADLYCTGHFGAVSLTEFSEIVKKTHTFVASMEKWAMEALSKTEPRPLHTIATHVSKQLPGYEFGYHIHGSTQSHLKRAVVQGRARTIMVNGYRHYLAT